MGRNLAQEAGLALAGGGVWREAEQKGWYVGGKAGRRGRPFLIASIFSAMEEARSSCEGVMGSLPAWEIEGAGLGEVGEDLGGEKAC